MTDTTLAIAIVSGGLDSVTLAYDLHAAEYCLHLLSFDYGQRHRRELRFAQNAAIKLGAVYTQVDIRHVGSLLGGSSLTDDIPVPDGHYAEPSMRQTVVPNRNAIMLSIAYGVAVAEQAEVVATAVHAGDHFIYPDCRPQFAESFDAMERLATEGFSHPGLRLMTPFIHKSKTDIVRLGASLGVPFAETWSCYRGLQRHCGTCGTCTERIEAFREAGITDPTEYEPQLEGARA